MPPEQHHIGQGQHIVVEQEVSSSVVPVLETKESVAPVTVPYIPITEIVTSIPTTSTTSTTTTTTTTGKRTERGHFMEDENIVS